MEVLPTRRSAERQIWTLRIQRLMTNRTVAFDALAVLLEKLLEVFGVSAEQVLMDIEMPLTAWRFEADHPATLAALT